MTLFVGIAWLRVLDVEFPAVWEWSIYDFTVRHLAPAAPTTEEIVAIEVDDGTLEELSQRWPISRAAWTGVLRQLASYNPAVIALDLYFPHATRDTCLDLADKIRTRVESSPCGDREALVRDIAAYATALEEDETLAQAIADIGIVVLGGVLPAEPRDDPLGAKKPSWLTPLRVTPPEPFHLSRNTMIASVATIGAASRATGLLNMVRDRDGVVRRYPYLGSLRGGLYPSLALAAVMVAHPDRASELIERHAMLDRGAPFLRFPARIRRVSLRDILRADARLRARLAGRIFIIGVTAVAEPEEETVPIAAETLYGLDVHAIAAANLLSGSYYRNREGPAHLGVLVAIVLLGALFAACNTAGTHWLVVCGLGVIGFQLVLYYSLLVAMGWLIAATPVIGGTIVLLAVEVGHRALKVKKRDRELLEQERISRAKSDLIAMVGHELRTPMTSIRGSLGLVAAGALGEVPAPISEMIHIAHNNTERLIRLVNSLLDLQKLEAGKMEFHFQSIELGAVLDETVTANRAYGDEFGVSIDLECNTEARVRADRDLLIQAITNLLSNAIKFSPRQENVTVTAEAVQSGSVRISVRDRGPGIPEEFRDHLFTRFSQAKNHADHPRGTGLGLYIVELIVAKHSGQISFDTELDRGTTFHIDLPVTEETDTPRTESSRLDS